MTLKIKVKYVLVYLFLNAIAFIVAFKFWWTDQLALSELNKFTFFLLLSVGISWAGILFISIMISRILILKTDQFSFISPLDLANNNYYLSQIGENKAKKFKFTIAFIAFSTLFLTILSFIFLMNRYENNALKKYGIVQVVSIKKVNYDIKKNKYVYFEYGTQKDTINLRSDSFKINDTTKIIYSEKNPKIIKFFDQYKIEK